MRVAKRERQQIVECVVLLSKHKASTRQDTAVHVSLSISTMSNNCLAALLRHKNARSHCWPRPSYYPRKDQYCLKTVSDEPLQVLTPSVLIDRWCGVCIGTGLTTVKGFFVVFPFFFYKIEIKHSVMWKTRRTLPHIAL